MKRMIFYTMFLLTLVTWFLLNSKKSDDPTSIKVADIELFLGLSVVVSNFLFFKFFFQYAWWKIAIHAILCLIFSYIMLMVYLFIGLEFCRVFNVCEELSIFKKSNSLMNQFVFTSVAFMYFVTIIYWEVFFRKSQGERPS